MNSIHGNEDGQESGNQDIQNIELKNFIRD